MTPTSKTSSLYTTYQAIRQAIQNNDLPAIKRLIAAGADPHQNEDWYLRNAACEDRPELVQYFLSLGLNAGIHGGGLRFALERGDMELMKTLLKAGANPAQLNAGEFEQFSHLNLGRESATLGAKNLLSNMGEGQDLVAQMLGEERPRTYLRMHRAVDSGNVEAAKEQVANGADFTYFDGYYLRQAARLGHTEMVKYLLSLGLDPNSDSGWPLRFATSQRQLGCVKALLRAGADPTLLDSRQAEILTQLDIDREDYRAGAKGMLSRGVTEDEGNPDTPKFREMTVAIKTGNMEDVIKLVQGGVDPHAWDDFFLRDSAFQNQLGLVKYFLALGLDPNDEDGTALQWAVSNRNVEMTQALLDAGADPSLLRGGYATVFANMGLTRKDVAKGAKTTLSRPWGESHELVTKMLGEEVDALVRTKMRRAVEDGDPETVAHLIQVNHPYPVEELSSSLLRAAIYHGRVSTVRQLIPSVEVTRAIAKALLSAGADISVLTPNEIERLGLSRGETAGLAKQLLSQPDN
jgi:ankyrin repeat protein